jgi:CDP-2,3-bis-(O-geranylgeranyl)-sn-glycerol synthase
MIETLLKELFFAFWFFAPAGLANVLAFGSGKIKSLRKYNYPADFNLKLHGKRLLGSHKTIRGFVIGVIASIAGVYLQIYLYNVLWFFPKLLSLNYNAVNPILFGFLLGFGALLGDSVKSFFKRLRGLQPGRSWVPFDQLDYIVGGIFLTWFYIKLSFFQYVFLFIVWIIIHPLISFIGYLLKFKRKPL